MFLGHYGLALAAKRVAPQTSAGTAVFASQFIDLLWPLLLLAGIERVRVVPGLMAANALDFEHYPVSHSLLAVLLWGALLGGAYFVVRRYRTGALVVGALVVSHWLLDALMHRPDLPLWPGSAVLVGGGAWNSLPLTVLLEFSVFTAGAAVYARTTKAVDRVGSWGFRALVVLLAVFYSGSLLGPPPEPGALAVGGVALWLFVPWMAWVDRHRVVIGRDATARTPAGRGPGTARPGVAAGS